LKRFTLYKFLFLCFIPFWGSSQDFLFQKQHAGFNFGGCLSLGSHFQRIGLVLNTYYVAGNHVQINVENRLHFNLKNLGPKMSYGEMVNSLGFVLGFGGNANYVNPFLSPVSNQTNLRYSIGYSFNDYRNKIKTSQQTGIISIQTGPVNILSENDLFARRSLDRFRTAAFLIQYQYRDKFQAGINCSMWTGKMGYKRENTDSHFYFGCYMDTTEGVYTNYSHGLLSAQVKFHAGNGQVVQTNAGIDAEQVRNFAQNKLIHDMIFLPRKWKKANNCHIPMLDEKGNQFLFQVGQKVKKATPYYNISSNQLLFF